MVRQAQDLPDARPLLPEHQGKERRRKRRPFEPPPAVRTAVDWQSLCQTQSNEDIARFQDALKKSTAAIEQAFKDGAEAAVLVKSRAWAVDRILIGAWRAFGLDARDDVALVAVGGYGRGELHPHSDIDLMLLLAAHGNADLERALSTFFTFLWDIGLPVGHSVRTVEDCVSEGGRDVTIITNLMESRLLAGPTALFDEMRQKTGPAHLWPSREFFAAKLTEQEARHQKFDNTAYKLEPNVKEGPGGLRDIQMVGWVAKRHFGGAGLQALVKYGFLTREEYRVLADGQNYLWKIRFALHLLAGRCEDRLLFDHQRALAGLFGYIDKDHNLAVEQFMQRYYRTVMELQRLNEVLLQLYKETILFAGGAEAPVPIDADFQVCKGFLEVTDKHVFRRHPAALLKLFLVMQQHPEIEGVRASTIRLVRRHCYLIDDAFRADPPNRALFMQILRQPSGITHELRRMNRYGVLAAYWPSFARIVGRMQYDLFHTYTVDEHTLFVLRNLRRFSVEEYAHELPFCHVLFKQVQKPEILYLAALFHDIGKGRDEDHSEAGAREAKTFCLQHGLSRYDANFVAWLVRHHLLMSMTAQRKDTTDPDVVNAFTEIVGNPARLDHLYLLTVADIRGTNPSLWNTWKDALLLELYHNARRVLRRGIKNPLDRKELIAETRRTALGMLYRRELIAQDCKRLWRNFSEDYFLRHSADEVAWHTQAILQAKPGEPLVLIRPFTARGCTEIFLYTRDQPYLFARVTAQLTQLGLDILDARIITAASGDTLDTFLVLDESGQAIADDFHAREIVDRLHELLRQPQKPPVRVTRPLPRRLRHFDVSTQVEFTNEPGLPHTIMELITTDHPGLLSRVGQAFIDCRIIVHNARIATVGEQAEDLFYITGLDRRPIVESDRLQRLRESVLAQLGELPGMEVNAV